LVSPTCPRRGSLRVARVIAFAALRTTLFASPRRPTARPSKNVLDLRSVSRTDGCSSGFICTDRSCACAYTFREFESRQRAKTAGLRSGFERTVGAGLEGDSACAFPSFFHIAVELTCHVCHRTCFPLATSSRRARSPIPDHALLCTRSSTEYLTLGYYPYPRHNYPYPRHRFLCCLIHTFAGSPEISTDRGVRLPKHATRRRRQNSDRFQYTTRGRGLSQDV
jgi:hypothetical protein